MPQRSPVIFWLLVAATLSVDAAAMAWLATDSSLPFASVAYDALLVSQLSVVCIWSALRIEKSLWSRIAPIVGVAVASLLFVVTGQSPLKIGLPYYGLHAALLLVALRFFASTTFWRQRSGASAVWQYSVAQLLIAMTVVAVLTTFLRESQLFAAGAALNNGALICGSVALAVVSVAVWSLALPWPIRLATVLGFAVFFGAAFIATGEQFLPLFVGAHYLIQAVVLSAWLAWGGIIPRASTANVVDHRSK